MQDSDFSLDALEELDHQIQVKHALASNKRVAVRYRRKDIKAVVKIPSLLFPRLVTVALHDISSRGAAVISTQKLINKGKIELFLLFSDGARFDIAAKIIHCESSTLRYGIKFDNANDALAEHLLHTQTDLHFS
jgi:hypothetical protein